MRAAPLLRLRRARTGLRTLTAMSDDERAALTRLATVVAEEHVAARRSPHIASSAWISPLASLRFTDRVAIGAKTSVGPQCCVWGGWSTAWVRIGDGVLLGPGAVLVAGNHGIGGTGPVREQPIEEADTVVEDGAWIGAHATVVGCRIGRGAVVGAGAVVLDDVPDLAIAVGVPARVVGRRT